MSENMPFWLPCYTLIPAIELLSELDWETANCLYEKFGENGTLGRETSSVVVLVPRLRAALVRLNPDLPSELSNLPSKNSPVTVAS
jgi:hypothetical protein